MSRCFEVHGAHLLAKFEVEVLLIIVATWPGLVGGICKSELAGLCGEAALLPKNASWLDAAFTMSSIKNVRRKTLSLRRATRNLQTCHEFFRVFVASGTFWYRGKPPETLTFVDIRNHATSSMANGLECKGFKGFRVSGSRV